jgi:LmbE family N-acetylglucosaminyl deacetylase
MNYLIVVAHPDDEVLGAGATIKKLTSEGNNVDICIMSTEVKARAFRPEDNELNEDLDASSNILGIRNKYEGTFPNIEMNNSTHLSLVQFIEKAIMESDCEVIITHHPADTNNDHMHTSMACQAAIRLFQRRNEVKPLKEFWFMEVLSSTEWSVNTAMNRFHPNTFVEVGEGNVNTKIAALATYRDVMRSYPHPRSVESITGLAAYRGAQSGCNYAEAFEIVLRRL